MPESMNLSLGKGIDLPKPLGRGTTLTISSDFLDISQAQDNRSPTKQSPNPNNPDMVYFTLLNNVGDILLRIHIMREENVIDLNCKHINEDWGIEKRIEYPDVRRAFGPDFSKAMIIVKNPGGKYWNVYASGGFLGSYTKTVGGDAERLEYGANEGYKPVFSETVKVTLE